MKIKLQLLILLSAIQFILFAYDSKSFAADEFFTKTKGQGYKAFLSQSTPKDFLKLIHATEKNLLKVGRKEILVGVYESQKSKKSNDQDSDPRQFTYGFVKVNSTDSKEVFVRKIIDSFFDDGGSPIEILAVFSATFESSKEPMLGILTVWDSSIAGGNSAMESSGKMYEVKVYELTSDQVFKQYKGKIINQLSTCDCQLYDENHKPIGHEKAKFKTIKEVKDLLNKLIGSY
jgi:ASC-1-like (ASCH) protein